MGYIAGHFGATYQPPSGQAADIGSTRSGIMHRDRPMHQDIVADIGGDAPVDGVQQGCMTELTLDYIEYDKVEAALYGQLGGATGKGAVMSKVGSRLTDLAGTLVLTAAAGTPAATTSGVFKIRTYPKAIVISDIQALLSSKLRQGPCTFRCFPDPSTGLTYTDTLAT